MAIGFFVFASLYIIGLVIRAFYEHFKKKGRIDPHNKLTFLVVFCAMCLLWASWFNMCPLDPYRLPMPLAVKWIGFGVFAVGLVFAIGALLQLKGVENIDRLVTTGLFSKFRHPMYTGFILWILGWAVYHGAILSLLLGCIAIHSILYWKRSEEHVLESVYGNAYLEYRKETWF